jgi:hypothetical protein
VQPRAYDAPLCGHTAEQFAEAALNVEPRGAAWCKQFTTVKAALHRALGRLLSEFEARLCVLLKEALACDSVELLSEWENEYGLPGNCNALYPTDIAGRQAAVCGARRALGIQTLPQLQALLQTALQCPHLRLEQRVKHSNVGGWTGGVGQSLTISSGICVSGITALGLPPALHNVVGGHGAWAAPYGSSVGQPLTVNDPSYVAPQACPIIYHSTVGGWTGGVGQPLQYSSQPSWGLLQCLMTKHLPATVAWWVCE